MHVLPDSITDDQGALLELLSVAVHAVRRSGMAAGDSASIVGAGPIGLVTLAAARAASAGEIFIVERATAGKDKARTGDAHHVVDPADGDPVQQIQALTPGGLGVDVACERVGHAVTLNVALEAIRKGGTAAIVGVLEEPFSVHFNDLVLSERTLVGVLGYVDDSPCAIALLADGRLSADPLITSRVAWTTRSRMASASSSATRTST